MILGSEHSILGLCCFWRALVHKIGFKSGKVLTWKEHGALNPSLGYCHYCTLMSTSESMVCLSVVIWLMKLGRTYDMSCLIKACTGPLHTAYCTRNFKDLCKQLCKFLPIYQTVEKSAVVVTKSLVCMEDNCIFMCSVRGPLCWYVGWG